MKPGWVAGTCRARALLGRRLGAQALAVARAPALADGLAVLAASGYGRGLPRTASVADAQRAVASTLLWHLRVLAGWLPPGGAEVMRVLAAPFEIANIEDRAAYVAGGPPASAFVLGSLATAWPAVSGTLSPAELRSALARSAWGDPGGDDPAAVRVGLLAAWARRVQADVPDAEDWAVGAVALQRAMPGALRPGEAPASPVRTPRGSGSMAAELAAARGAGDLFGAELGWWRGVEQDASGLARQTRNDRAVITGCVALLAVDAWRVSAALEGAARGGSPDLAELLAWT